MRNIQGCQILTLSYLLQKNFWKKWNTVGATEISPFSLPLSLEKQLYVLKFIVSITYLTYLCIYEQYIALFEVFKLYTSSCTNWHFQQQCVLTNFGTVKFQLHGSSQEPHSYNRSSLSSVSFSFSLDHSYQYKNML